VILEFTDYLSDSVGAWQSKGWQDGSPSEFDILQLPITLPT
jgi:hypothetical protein